MFRKRMPVHEQTRRRVVVAGASGFIGRAVVESLRARGDEVTVVGRTAGVAWNDAAALVRAVEGAEVVVNLAGKSVNCRYTDRNRDEILRSRIETTRALRTAIAAASSPPAVWLNASTATIYRHRTDAPHTEHAGELGTGFSVDVARAWEEELFAGELPQTRRVAMRMAIVLGDGPATRMLTMLARSASADLSATAGGCSTAATAASGRIRAATGARRTTAPADASASAGCTSTTSWPRCTF